jgi:hypothetical protein
VQQATQPALKSVGIEVALTIRLGPNAEAPNK